MTQVARKITTYLKKLKQLVSFFESHKQTKALAKKIFFAPIVTIHGVLGRWGGGGGIWIMVILIKKDQTIPLAYKEIGLG